VPVDRIVPGQAVRSLTGRDRGRLYVVVGFAPPYVLVADGRDRGADRPKKKNVRHIGVLKYVDEGVAAKIAGGAKATDRELRAALRAATGTNSDADEEGILCPSRT
jgi:ribosomal protein L14E/L6E/L27E